MNTVHVLPGGWTEADSERESEDAQDPGPAVDVPGLIDRAIERLNAGARLPNDEAARIVTELLAKLETP